MSATHIKLGLTGAFAYTAVTFPLAAIWHAIMFRSLYEQFGYLDGEPSFALGFLTILLQGLVMSFLYPRISFSGDGMVRGLKFALALGAFFWTSHVLAFVAKQEVHDALSFVLMETLYLAIQFALFGILIGLISNRFSVSNEAGAVSAA